MAKPKDIDVAQLIREANGRRAGPMKRVVIRLDPAVIMQIEAIQAGQPKGTARAAVARALLLLGLDAEEARARKAGIL